MSNLLPERDKKKIKKEYLLRLLVVILLFSAVSVLFNTMMLFPAYFLSENKIETAQERIDFLKFYLEKKKESGLSFVLSPTTEKINALNLDEKFLIGQSIQSILSKKGNLIKINEISIQSINTNKVLFIGGVASNRDSLISFSESLKSISNFTDVHLPLSNLAKNTDVDFNIKIDLKIPDTEQ